MTESREMVRLVGQAVDALKAIGAAGRALTDTLQETNVRLKALEGYAERLADAAEATREKQVDALLDAMRAHPDSWGDALAKVDSIGPEGGTIDLPDGTRIEIRPTDD